MKKYIFLFTFSLLLSVTCIAQSEIKDDAIDNQEQRMVFQQWDQNKFYPKPGFLSLNPYYWLVWGLFYPLSISVERAPSSLPFKLASSPLYQLYNPSLTNSALTCGVSGPSIVVGE